MEERSHLTLTRPASPVHLPFQSDRWLAIDAVNHIISQLALSPPRIVAQQIFSKPAMHLAVVLLAFPEECPYGSLLAALETDLELLCQWFSPPPHPQLHPFVKRRDDYTALLQQADSSEKREMSLRYLRRCMTEVSARMPRLGLRVICLRSQGYQLGTTLQPHSESLQARGARNTKGVSLSIW
jgi:hypothetical protein